MLHPERTRYELDLWRKRTTWWLSASLTGLVISLILLKQQHWIPWVAGISAGALTVLRMWAEIHERLIVNTLAKAGIVIGMMSVGIAVQQVVKAFPAQAASQGIAAFVLAFSLAGLTATLIFKVVDRKMPSGLE